MGRVCGNKGDVPGRWRWRWGGDGRDYREGAAPLRPSQAWLWENHSAVPTPMVRASADCGWLFLGA